ncbi:MAG: ribonuclease HI family protein [Patescibacteria group bacterium]
MEKIIIYTDGGARGNPGPAGIGAVIADTDGNVLKEIAHYIGEQTNNYAEYEALIHALAVAREMFGDKIHDMQISVYMDSELVVRQLTGAYKVKDPGLKEQFARVGQLAGTLKHISYNHVMRAKNVRADKLVNEAIDKAME